MFWLKPQQFSVNTLNAQLWPSVVIRRELLLKSLWNCKVTVNLLQSEPHDCEGDFMTSLLAIITGGIVLIICLGLLGQIWRVRAQLTAILQQQREEQQQQRTQFDQHQLNAMKLLQESVHLGMQQSREQLSSTLKQHGDFIGQRLDRLTQETQKKLKDISDDVEKRLNEGFEKTTQTFTDVVKRLAIIDEAQKKITELSGNVVNLQEVLNDKKSRGTFGEVQLSNLIRNMIPEHHFSFQHTFSNGKRADCVLFLPEPSGTIAIDAKFPLENYRLLSQPGVSDSERKTIEQRFRADIRIHIKAIAEKYIIANETSEGAMMFIPAEGIFADIHAYFGDLVEEAQRAHVWMVSPTTMMAILTTARAVLKDAATRKQVHIIQEHLVGLSKDFDRFQQRMDKLSQHIQQAHKDVEDVHRSSKKISSRFTKIEKVELLEEAPAATLE